MAAFTCLFLIWLFLPCLTSVLFHPFLFLDAATCACVQGLSDRNCIRRCAEAFGEVVNTTLLGISIVVLGISSYTSVEGPHAGTVVLSFLTSRLLSWGYAVPIGWATFSYGYFTERYEIEHPPEETEDEDDYDGCFSFANNVTDQLSVGTKQ